MKAQYFDFESRQVSLQVRVLFSKLDILINLRFFRKSDKNEKDKFEGHEKEIKGI